MTRTNKTAVIRFALVFWACKSFARWVADTISRNTEECIAGWILSLSAQNLCFDPSLAHIRWTDSKNRFGSGWSVMNPGHGFSVPRIWNMTRIHRVMGCPLTVQTPEVLWLLDRVERHFDKMYRTWCGSILLYLATLYLSCLVLGKFTAAEGNLLLSIFSPIFASLISHIVFTQSRSHFFAMV